MRSGWRAAITAAAGLVIMTGPAARAADEPATVHIAGYHYQPASMTVTAGSTVEWMNDDVAGHDVSVVSGPAMFTSPKLAKGQMWQTTLTVPGVYQYICSIHPDMTASVTVTAPTTTTTTMGTTTTTMPMMAASALPMYSTTTTSTTSLSTVGAAAMAAPIAHQSAPSAPVAPLGRLAVVCAAVVAASLLLLGKRREEET